MDSLKNIFKKKGKSSKSGSSRDSGDIPVMEVSETRQTGGLSQIEPIVVKSLDLNSVVDVQEVSTELESGNIIILNISPLMDEDPAELKRAIDKLKDLARDIGGDVGRLSESRIIATPKLVRIQFKR